MKIYTRGGDKGKTSLIGGKRVPKNHKRIEAYGTLDELISYVGLLRDQDIGNKTKDFLITIQHELMICASLLATDKKENMNALPKIPETAIEELENEIDRMEETLPTLNSFILPGGHTLSSYCQITRCICRRAERQVIGLSKKYRVPEIIVRYLNRLSDYFFVLARKINHDYKGVEIIWKP
ncbi:MAG: cob(I)yrinic acid a,c-diamide adenosyltransferase [Bacteroidales bacterium]|nr:cob(I)yrinic acid a,c-diamide adenosyltransferase [Bacteroidales bacterium]